MYRFPLLSSVLLAGCTSLAPGAALWLNDVDPLSADPSEITVALDLPEGLGVLPDSVKLHLEARHEDQGEVAGTWTLEVLEEPDARWLFRMAEADWTEVQRVQQQARAWESSDPDRTTGSLSVAVGGCRTDDTTDLSDARASVSMSLASESPPRPIFQNAPIAQVLSQDEIAALPACP